MSQQRMRRATLQGHGLQSLRNHDPQSNQHDQESSRLQPAPCLGHGRQEASSKSAHSASRLNKISMIRPGLGVHIDDTFPRPPTFVLTSQNAVQHTSATTACVVCTLRTYIQSVPMFRFVGPDITGVRLSKSLSASAHRAWRITIAQLVLAVGGQAQMTQRVVFPQARHAQVLFCSVLSRRPPSYSFPAYFILHTLVLSCPVLNCPVPVRPVLSRRAPVLSGPQC